MKVQLVDTKYMIPFRHLHRHNGARVHVPDIPVPGAVPGGGVHALPHHHGGHDAPRQAPHRGLQQLQRDRAQPALHLVQAALL